MNTPAQVPLITVTPLPAFSDNYIWCLQARDSNHVVIIDPGDAQPVLTYLQAEQRIPVAILITHHHWDHISGIKTLLETYPDLPVYGPAREAIPAMRYPLTHGDRVQIDALDINLQVIDVPGHTAGHIAYYCPGYLFCGDTLFANGCGKIFDGTLDQLADSLEKLAQLPAETRIYCTHEYTLDNIGFARWVEPDNPELLKREQREKQRRKQGHPTLPSTLALELKTNPFLRTQQPAVMTAASRQAGKPLQTHREIFAVLRRWKDTEYD